MTEPPMVERIPDILQRLASLETAMKHSDEMLRSSVDDIKATIRSEVSDLKGEQIGDLRAAQQKLMERMDRVEQSLSRWVTGASVVDWLIRFAILVGGALAGIFGARHIGVGP